MWCKHSDARYYLQQPEPFDNAAARILCPNNFPLIFHASVADNSNDPVGPDE